MRGRGADGQRERVILKHSCRANSKISISCLQNLSEQESLRRLHQMAPSDVERWFAVGAGGIGWMQECVVGEQGPRTRRANMLRRWGVAVWVAATAGFA